MGSLSYDLNSIPNPEDYDVCPHFGFAASDGCMLRNLGPYYKPWDDLVSNLSSLLASKRVRHEVRALPVLKIDKLDSDAKRRRAYMHLAFLTQAFVFETPGAPEAMVPRSISEPFLDLCSYWGMEPILSHISYDLWNWRLGDQLIEQESTHPLDVAKTRCLLLQDLHNAVSCGSFTSAEDEKVFNMVPLLVEVEGGVMVSKLLDALKAAISGDMDVVLATLLTCSETLTAMSKHFQILNERCNPQVFYNRIRPLITGSRGMEEKGLPDGFIFELGDGRTVSSKRAGATAGQSPLFQVLDHMFGIEHKTDFMLEMRSYMPRKHREFLDAVDKLPNLRTSVEAHPEMGPLQTAFEQCVTLLRAWRTKHVGLVTRYIVIPAKSQANSEAVKGTGGSSPLPFVKEIRDDTV